MGSPRRSSALRGTRVVVVGAGLAGLVAARDLQHQGADVHVVEARDRLGGRVWTLRNEVFAPYSIEAGGEFIESDHKAIRALAGELGLRLVRVLKDGFGLALDIDGRLKVYKTQARLWRAFKAALSPLASELEEAGGDWHSSLAAVLARRSLDEVLTAREASSELRAMAEALRGLFLASSDSVSSLVGIELSMEGTDPGHVRLYRIDGGNDQLILGLTRGRKVRYSGKTAVKRVQQDADGVLVTVEGPSSKIERLVAAYIVVTVPPPELLSWEFSPPLPDDQHRALSALTLGPATKALVGFAKPWWRERKQPRAFGTNLPTGAIWDAAEEQPGAAVLTLLGGGPASLELRELLQQHGADGVMARLDWLGRATEVRAIEEICWERDKWARGGYVVLTPGFEPAWRDLPGRAFDRVLFAGEHTSRDFQGYMEGAVQSGYRVAKELAQLERVRILTARPPESE